MDILKAGFPYLVDIAITNYCNEGCPFCYIDASTKGKHAELEFLQHLSQILLESKVFECCFGGGSVTDHPEFFNILKSFKDKWFKVSFSTKKYDLSNIPQIEQICEQCDSMAFSCNTIEELNLLTEKVKFWQDTKYHKNDWFFPQPSLYIQTILGLKDFNYFLKFISHIKGTPINHVTILGYKNFGRGVNFTPFEVPDNWFELISNQNKYLNFGIDSILAEKYRAQLIKFGIKENTLVCKEGYTTCFIDAVNMKVKRSSFCEEGVDITKDITSKEFLEIFASFI